VIVDHAADDRGVVVAHRNHEASRRQLTIGQMVFAAGADRHDREPFCALLFKREALPSKIRNNFVSHFVNLAMSVGRRLYKRTYPLLV
jgi:hypothetical protein